MLLLAIVYTWPVLISPDRIIPGSFETDQNQNIWSLWWFKRALLDLHTNPYFSRYLFYPYGTDLYLYALEPLNGLLALPVNVLFGSVAAFSFVCISGLALTGVTATALCRNICGSKLAAPVGGYIITFGLVHFSFVALGQLEFVALWPLLLYLTFLVKLLYLPWPSVSKLSSILTVPTRGYIFGATLSLLLAAFTTLYYAAYAAIFTLLFFGLRAIQMHHWRWLGASLARLALVWILFGASFGLFARQIYAEEKDATNQIEVSYQVVLNESVAVSSYFTQFDGNSLLGSLAGIPRLAQTNVTHYLGYSLLILVGLGLLLSWRQRANRPWPWLLAGLIFAALSFGPTIRTDATTDPPSTPALLFMPWNWIQDIPLFNLTHTPKRFALLLLICLGVLASLGLTLIWQRWPKRWGLVVGLVLVGGVVLEGPALPGLTRTVVVPPEVSLIQADCAKIECENSAVLDLPFSKDHYLSDSNLMLWGALRQKPVMGGYLSRRIDDPYDPEQSAFRVFRQLAPLGDIFSPGADDAEVEILNYYHIRYITVNRKEYQRIYGKAPEKLSGFLESNLGQSARIYQTDKLEIYRVPELKPAEKRPFIIVGTGWRDLETENPPKRWIGSDASITIYSFEDSRPADLVFEGVAFAGMRHMTVTFNGQKLDTIEVKNDGWQSLKISGLVLKKGENILRLDPIEAAQSPAELDPTSKDTRNLSIALRQVQLISR